MNINRHNYEEYFLLYVDNELSPTQRTAVEAFVAANTDLQTELDMLQQATLMPEPIYFNDKTQLLQHNNELINLANCQSYFLSYVDHELSIEESAATEKFVLQHPDVQPAFDSFKKAVLPIETIVFEDKESLYRKEEKVVVMRWWRMAAAAVVIGLGIAIWMVAPTKQTLIGSEIAVNTTPTPSTDNSNLEQAIPVEDNATTSTMPVISGPADMTAPVSTNAQSSIYQAVNKTSQQPKQNALMANKEDKVSPAVVIDIPVTTPTKTVTTNKKTDIVVASKPDIADRIEKPEASTLYTAASADGINNTAVITPTVYRTLETEDDEKNVVYIGGAQINKQKLKGLFKTVTKMFEKPGRKKQAKQDEPAEEDNQK
jgi:hypothetical protein